MSLFLFKDNVSTTLANAALSTDTTLVVATGHGADFPAPGAGQKLSVTLEDTSGNIEVVYCTGITSDTLTVVRAQEGTTALGFASGSRVEMRVTSGVLAVILQKSGGDTLSGTTNLSGVLALGGGGSIQGGEFTGALRGGPGQTVNQILVPVTSGDPTASGSVILTKANLLNNLPSGVGVISSGMVLMWNGASGSIPTGYLLCDGTSGTPNLKDQFIVGAGNLYAWGSSGGSAATATGSTDPSGSLSVAGHALTIAELPAHHHSMWTGGYAANGSNSALVTLLNGGTQQNTFPAGASGISGNQIIGDTGSGNTHTHGLTGGLAHTHSITLPPYYALFFIQKA